MVWLVLAGRGFGKTRTGAEWVIDQIRNHGAKRVALVGPTAGDVRDVMIEGESGILACCPPDFRPKYEPSKRRVVFANGAICTAYSADEPERLRGPQHDRAWCDEIAAWRYAEAWDMLMMGLRLGDNPQAVVTTTPKPIKLLRDLIAEPTTIVTKGRTKDNEVNLAQPFIDRIIKKYEGTRLGRQELDAELLEDVPNALWTYARIDATRRNPSQLPGYLEALGLDRMEMIRRCMVRIVVAVDPSGSKGAPTEYQYEDKSNDIGIVVVGRGKDGHAYVLEDLTINASPAVWGRVAVDAYHRWKADRIVAERNFGGAMVEHVIRSTDRMCSYKDVIASRGKAVRAEPVSSLYEGTQQRPAEVHHLGAFPQLETQMSMMTSYGYTGDGSPDRVDALVWGITELMLANRIAPTPAIGRATTIRRHNR